MNEENQTVSGNEVAEDNIENVDTVTPDIDTDFTVSDNDGYADTSVSSDDISGNDILAGYADTDNSNEITISESALSEETLLFYEDIKDGINQTNALLTMLFFFTVFVWVEKKIKNAVGKVMKNE